jgi:thiopeptide-type bacteriocin biosynthesis protein
MKLKYVDLGFCIARIPLLPLDVLERLHLLPDSVPETPDEPNGNTNSDFRSDQLLAVDQQLGQLLDSTVVSEAITIASPSMAMWGISYINKGSDSKRARQARLKLVKYVTRMSTRPTPMGLFAGVSVIEFGRNTDIHVGAADRRRTRTRPDMGWIMELVASVESKPQAVAHIRHLSNPLNLRYGGRVVLGHTDSLGRVRDQTRASIGLTPAVEKALDIATSGRTLSELVNALSDHYPSIAKDRVVRLVEALRTNGFLISELRPSLTEKDPIKPLLAVIQKLPGCSREAESLEMALAQAAAYDRRPLGEGAEHLPDIEIPSASGCDAHQPPTFQIDTQVHLDASTLSKKVADEVARAAQIMLDLPWQGFHYPHLDGFSHEFTARYGASEVSLVELLDEDIGLGPPDTYRFPPGPSRRNTGSSERHLEATRYLFELVHEGTISGSREVSLKSEDLDRLKSSDSWMQSGDPLPQSLDVIAHISAASAMAIDSGDFEILVDRGVSGAGRSLARFLDFLPERVSESLRDLARDEQEADPQRIHAELVHLPSEGRLANVAIRPRFRSHEIRFQCGETPNAVSEVDLRDIAVGVRSGRFYLRDQASGLELLVRASHVLNMQLQPNLCRFLLEVSLSESKGFGRFDWGLLENAPFLPRVRVGRVILRVAEWKMPAYLRRTAGQLAESEWCEQVRQWSRNWFVPQMVFLVSGDQRLLLNLDHPVCVAILQAAARKLENPVVLEEMFPTPEGTWVGGSTGRYVAEFAIPLVARSPARTTSPPLVPDLPYSWKDWNLPPGSTWLYIKLYGPVALQEDLLIDLESSVLDGLVDGQSITRWFFVRYADPDPHLRVRLEGEPSVLQREVLSRINAWSGSQMRSRAIQTVSIHTYRREVGRYGGEAGCDLAESLFTTDTQYAMELIRHAPKVELSRDELALLSLHEFTLSIGRGVASPQALFGHMVELESDLIRTQRIESDRAYRENRDHLERLIGDLQWREGIVGGAPYADILRRRNRSLKPLARRLAELAHSGTASVGQGFIASVAHMHCNRLLGVDRLREADLKYRILRTLRGLSHHEPDWAKGD